MRAVIPEGLTIGELVDEVIDGAAENERQLAVGYIRRVANELPEGQLFPPNLIGLITDLLHDIADDLEACEHFSEIEEGEGVRLQ